MAPFKDYPETTFEAYENDDEGGTAVLAGNPYVFYKGNMAEWLDVL